MGKVTYSFRKSAVFPSIFHAWTGGIRRKWAEPPYGTAFPVGRFPRTGALWEEKGGPDVLSADLLRLFPTGRSGCAMAAARPDGRTVFSGVFPSGHGRLPFRVLKTMPQRSPRVFFRTGAHPSRFRRGRDVRRDSGVVSAPDPDPDPGRGRGAVNAADDRCRSCFSGHGAFASPRVVPASLPSPTFPERRAPCRPAEKSALRAVVMTRYGTVSPFCRNLLSAPPATAWNSGSRGVVCGRPLSVHA